MAKLSVLKALAGGIQKSIPPSLSPPMSGQQGGWWPLIREAFAGAWQENAECRADWVLSFPAIYSCITLIQSDIGKLRIKLVQQKPSGIWAETKSSSFTPVLSKPNRYQTRIQFLQNWVASEMVWGNTYVYKERDNRGVVVAMYVLNPRCVMPLVSPDGSVFYQLGGDLLAGLDQSVIVPASEIIHDRVSPLFHPLVGISPLYAAALSGAQGLEIQRTAERFFRRGANPSGILTAPGSIDQDVADDVKKKWQTNFSGQNAGSLAILSDGLKYEQMTMSSVDAQLVEQLQMSGEQVCTAFHVPAYMVGIGEQPTYDNIEALQQKYYSQCLQVLIEQIEILLDEGLGLVSAGYGCELDVSQLLRMDKSARIKANAEAIKGCIITINEARADEELAPVPGGDTIYMQQQNFSLESLTKRDALANPFVVDNPLRNPTPSAAGSVEQADADQKAKLLELDAAFEFTMKQLAPLALPAPITEREVA